MDVLYTYRDVEGQLLPLDKRGVGRLQTADELESQVLFLRVPIYPDACSTLTLNDQALLPLVMDTYAEAVLLSDGEPTTMLTLDAQPECTLTLDVEGSALLVLPAGCTDA